MQIFAGENAISLLPIGLLILAVVLIVSWRRKRSASYVFCAAILGIYLLFAVEQVFFPIRVIEPSGDLFEMGLRSSVNLVPLRFNFTELTHIVVLQILLNVLLTVPLGFGVNFVAHMSPRRILLLALAVGLGIEAIQFVIGVLLGYLYRIIDVNDMLLNALGVLIGYGVFRLFAWLYRRAMRRMTKS